MKNRISICLAVGTLLALAAGCGKTDNAQNSPPAAPQAAQPASPPKMEPAPAAMDAAKAVQDSAVKAAAAVTPGNAVAPAGTVAPQAPTGQTATSLADLSQAQMVQGLQEALGKGLEQAVARLGHDGGFLTNLNVKIPMPEKLQTVEKTLRAMKQDKLADDFVTTMNHAAEQAVPAAGSVFADALRQMTIADAKSILNGSNNAATQYFERTTQTNLYGKFYPIVQQATAKTGVTAAYKNLMEKANATQGLGSFGGSLGANLLGKDSMDIDAYVTNKALDGLFKMVAEEEQQIRQNPVARTTATLQKVFGAFTK